MVEEIGAVGDDYSNRFTARVLLLINSRPLVNGDQYQLAREEVLHAYWRRAESPDKEFFLSTYLTTCVAGGTICY
jgi:hypothetical protein